MKRTPGPLTIKDKNDIVAFQRDNGCLQDGMFGRQTKDALWWWASLPKKQSFDWLSAAIGGIVGAFLALMF